MAAADEDIVSAMSDRKVSRVPFLMQVSNCALQGSGSKLSLIPVEHSIYCQRS